MTSRLAPAQMSRVVRGPWLSIAILVTASIPLWTHSIAQEPVKERAEEKGFSPFVDAKGGISLPKDYRKSWVHLGSFVVEDEDDPGEGFHDVYARPETVAHYLEKKEFPDGAVLVKEIRKIRESKMTTGDAMWAGEPKSWFVTIKDRKARFPNNSNWGEGWGWALFEAEDPTKNVSTDYKADCIGCHKPAQPEDWVYVGGYPTLLEP